MNIVFLHQSVLVRYPPAKGQLNCARDNFILRLQHSWTPTNPLLHCHGFCQVAWLVYVAATGDGHVVGKELQRDDCQQGAEHL